MLSSSDNRIDSLVVSLVWHGIYQLKREAKTYGVAVEMWQQAVVVATAAPQPIACCIECNAGNDCEVDGVVLTLGQQIALRFNDVERTTMRVRSRIAEVKLKIIAHNGGQQYLFHILITLYELVRTDLVGQ